MTEVATYQYRQEFPGDNSLEVVKSIGRSVINRAIDSFKKPDKTTPLSRIFRDRFLFSKYVEMYPGIKLNERKYIYKLIDQDNSVIEAFEKRASWIKYESPETNYCRVNLSDDSTRQIAANVNGGELVRPLEDMTDEEQFNLAPSPICRLRYMNGMPSGIRTLTAILAFNAGGIKNGSFAFTDTTHMEQLSGLIFESLELNSNELQVVQGLY